MYGMFVNENGGVRYAWAIASGIKTVETRSRNMLSALVGKRVAVVRTHRNSGPVIVGYVNVDRCEWVDRNALHKREWQERTLIPTGSEYDCTGKGKYCYFLSNAERLEPPISLPANAIRHGRSWCEWEEV